MRYPSALTALFLIAPLVTLAGTVVAQPAAPDASPAAPAQKLICVRGQAETGSHFGASKVCHTQSEWAVIHGQSAQTMERYETQTRQQAPGGGH